MPTYSKFLNEYIVQTNVNDRFVVERISPAETHVVTLTNGRYRDFESLIVEIDTQLETKYADWNVQISTSGVLTINCDEEWDINWYNTAYGDTLHDDLGFDGTEAVNATFSLTGSSGHVGGFYPTEPVEADDRPDEDGTDRWMSDTAQQRGRTGMVGTKGGSIYLYDRAVTFLLPQADLTPFSNWLKRCAQGYSFAYYHDRDEAWDGPSDEYEEYKLVAGDEEGIRYNPERVEPANTTWHRQTVTMLKRVAPTA